MDKENYFSPSVESPLLRHRWGARHDRPRAALGDITNRPREVYGSDGPSFAIDGKRGEVELSISDEEFDRLSSKTTRHPDHISLPIPRVPRETSGLGMRLDQRDVDTLLRENRYLQSKNEELIQKLARAQELEEKQMEKIKTIELEYTRRARDLEKEYNDEIDKIKGEFSSKLKQQNVYIEQEKDSISRELTRQRQQLRQSQAQNDELSAKLEEAAKRLGTRDKIHEAELQRLQERWKKQALEKIMHIKTRLQEKYRAALETHRFVGGHLDIRALRAELENLGKLNGALKEQNADLHQVLKLERNLNAKTQENLREELEAEFRQYRKGYKRQIGQELKRRIDKEAKELSSRLEEFKARIRCKYRRLMEDQARNLELQFRQKQKQLEEHYQQKCGKPGPRHRRETRSSAKRMLEDSLFSLSLDDNLDDWAKAVM